jgi:hypothetical protein
MPNIKFNFTAMRQARPPMNDFLIDWYFNGFCKGRKNFVLTLCEKQRLCAMLHSEEFRLCAMQLSAEFYKRCAVPPIVKSKSKIFLPTLHYAAQPQKSHNIDCVLGSLCYIRTVFHLNCLTAQLYYKGRAAVSISKFDHRNINGGVVDDTWRHR